MSSLTSTIPKTRSSAAAPSRLRRITVDEYERMIRAGALDDPKRVELIGGYLVQKMAKSAEHGYATKKLIKGVGVAVAGRVDMAYGAARPHP